MDDPARHVAYHEIYQLASGEEAPPARGGAGQEHPTLDALSPSQRDVAYRIAQRRLAFQLMYEYDAAGAATPMPEWLDHAIARVADLGPVVASQVRELVAGAHEGRGDADAALTRLAPDWPTHRLAPVDRAILRLGHFELTTGRTPAPVAINEAVELARAFGTDRSPAFVNALLDKCVVRDK
jgi:N utilization substance protein B